MTKKPIGIIGGSGLYQMEEVKITEEKWVDTPFGKPSDAVMLGELAGRAVAFLPRHGRGHRIPPHQINYRANIYALKTLGVEQIISISAVGSMKEDIHPGHFVTVDQFIDRTKVRSQTFYEDGIAVHVGFAEPICNRLRTTAAGAAREAGVTIHDKGAYVCIEGPMFSSRAESNLYRSWGATVIGMTNYQEAKLAREAEICYSTIALSTDYCSWKEDEVVDVQKVLATIHANISNAQQTLKHFVAAVDEGAECSCRKALQGAIMTDVKLIPEETKAKLKPMIGKYL